MAAGSQSGWHGLPVEKRVCLGCGQRVVLAEPGGLWMEGMPCVGVWHHACKLASASKGAGA